MTVRHHATIEVCANGVFWEATAFLASGKTMMEIGYSEEEALQLLFGRLADFYSLFQKEKPDTDSVPDVVP